MNVSLTSELEKFVQEKVTCGMYASVSEVIRASLRLMYIYDGLQKQRIAQLNDLISEGMEQLHQKQYVKGEVSREKMKNRIDVIAKKKTSR